MKLSSENPVCFLGFFRELELGGGGKRTLAVFPTSATAFFRGVFAGVGSIPSVSVGRRNCGGRVWEGSVLKGSESSRVECGSECVPVSRPDFCFRGELWIEPGGDNVADSRALCFFGSFELARAGGKLGGGVA